MVPTERCRAAGLRNSPSNVSLSIIRSSSDNEDADIAKLMPVLTVSEAGRREFSTVFDSDV